MKKILDVVTLLCLGALVGCENADYTQSDLNKFGEKIVDVDHTPAERQSIGNCWVYANASWAESMHKRATGDDFDISQSYWTYMDWFTKILEGKITTEDAEITISTGGLYSYAQKIIRNYGLMEESAFILSDSYKEASYAQSSALKKINKELREGGRLYNFDGTDRALVREVLDEAWNLDENVKAQLTDLFGEKLDKVFSADDEDRTAGTDIIHPKNFEAYYNKKTRTLYDAVNAWQYTNYSPYNSKSVLKRVRKALHDREPVIISWMVDFNAFEENRNSPLYGSFNSQTLMDNGEIGHQGGHMTVLEDYEAVIFHKQIILEESGDVDKEEMYSVSTPVVLSAGAKVVVSGTGDADLYVQKDTAPTLDSYTCRPYASGSNEECVIEEAGEYYMAVNGYRASSFKLQVVGPEKTEELVEAGIFLDPKNTEDKEKLDMLLGDDTEIVFFRIKNSWGGEQRPSLAYAPHSEKGYHDLYMDYLDVPFRTEENCENGLGSDDCAQNGSLALTSFVLPPEYFTDGEEEDVDPEPEPQPEPQPQPEPTEGNLILNGTFESGLTAGWTIIDSGIEVVEATDAYQGERAAKIIVKTGSQSDTDFRQVVAVEEGRTYTFSAMVKNPSQTIRARLFHGNYASYSNLSSSDWQMISKQFTATTTGEIEVGIRFYDSAGFSEGDEILIDDIQLVQN